MDIIVYCCLQFFPTKITDHLTMPQNNINFKHWCPFLQVSHWCYIIIKWHTIKTSIRYQFLLIFKNNIFSRDHCANDSNNLKRDTYTSDMPCNFFQRFLGMVRVGNLFIFLFCGVVFLFCLVSSMLPVNMDFPFLIIPSVFSYVYSITKNDQKLMSIATAYIPNRWCWRDKRRIITIFLIQSFIWFICPVNLSCSLILNNTSSCIKYIHRHHLGPGWLNESGSWFT
jgi:hypothetical protein